MYYINLLIRAIFISISLNQVKRLIALPLFSEIFRRDDRDRFFRLFVRQFRDTSDLLIPIILLLIKIIDDAVFLCKETLFILR